MDVDPRPFLDVEDEYKCSVGTTYEADYEGGLGGELELVPVCVIVTTTFHCMEYQGKAKLVRHCVERLEP